MQAYTRILALFKREFTLMFNTALGYTFIVLFMFVESMIFFFGASGNSFWDRKSSDLGFFFSGIFYPFWKMPQALQIVASFFPLAHGVTLLQALAWGKPLDGTFAFHLGALALQALVFCGIASLLLVRKLRA